jgi:hypothetical protein
MSFFNNSSNNTNNTIQKLNGINKHIFNKSEAQMFHASTSYLDYTFLSHRRSISNTRKLNIDIKKKKNYLFDLKKTFELNFEILKKTTPLIENEQERNEIKKKINNINSVIENKKKLEKTIENIKSKILIENQIYSENKRKIQETADYYKEQIKDNEENLDNKEEYIKIFQRKLKEVEIYIQKNTKDLKNSKYVKYQNWKMNDFLEDSDVINREKEDLKKEIDKIKNEIDNVKKENLIFNLNEEVTQNQTQSFKDEQQEKRIKNYIKKYKKNIVIISNRIKYLKNNFDRLSKTLNLLNLGKKNYIKYNQNEINNKINYINPNKTINEENESEDNNNNNGNNQSILPLDISRKINNYMDFSIVLNKKNNDVDTSKISRIDYLDQTGGFGGNFGNISNINMWDISVINNKNND